MFALLKRIFGQSDPVHLPEMEPEAVASDNGFIKLHRAIPRPTVLAPIERNLAETEVPPLQSVVLNLLPIVQNFPEDLLAALEVLPSPNQTVELSIENLPAQLKRGSVRTTFAEVRKNAGASFASISPDFDHTSIGIPLSLILPKIRLQRRTEQREIVVPQAASVSEFDLKRQSPEDLAPPPAKPPAPAAPPPPPKVEPVVSAQGPAPALRISLENDRPLSMPAPEMPTAEAAPAVRLAVLEIEDWLPGEAITEVTRLQLEDRVIHLPTATVAPALGEKSLTLPWGQLLSWMRPAAPASITPDLSIALPLELIAPRYYQVTGQSAPEAAPELSDSVLEIELEDFAEDFTSPPTLPRSPAPESPAPPRIEITPVAEMPAEPALRIELPEKAITPEVAVAPQVDTPAPSPEMPTAVNGSEWTPDAVAGRIRALDGVENIVIASRDGLVVAAETGSEIDATVFSAFLPEITVRTTVYVNEMNLPAPDHIEISMGDRRLLLATAGDLFFGAVVSTAARITARDLQKFARDLETHGSTL